MYELKKEAFLGVLWKSGNFIFNQVVLLIVKLVLIRLLIPEEFGIVSMAFIVISSLQLINAFGTGTAYVRDNKSDPKRAKNTLFYLDTSALTLIALIGFFSAPYVAGFFSKKISDPGTVVTLVWMIRVIALQQLLSIVAIVPRKILTKKLRFKEGVVAAIVGTISYGVIAIVLAYLGFGAWAIILAQLANTIISNIVIFFYSPFIPSLIFDKQIAKKYLNFGKEGFFTSAMGVIINNGDDTIVGRVLGSAALGFYNLGQHFAGLVVSIISGMINGVMFPVFSKTQDNKELFTRAFYKAFRLTNMLTIPAIAGAVVLSKEIVLLIFGQNWLPLLPVFYILSISSILSHVVALAGPVLNSLNKPSILRNNRLIQFGFYVVLVYPFTRLWGLEGVSVVFVIFSIVSLIHFLPILSREISNFYSYMFKILLKIIPVTLFMMAVVYFVKKIITVNLFFLFMLVLLGVVVYFIPMWFLDKELKWDLQEGWSVLKEKFLR